MGRVASLSDMAFVLLCIVLLADPAGAEDSGSIPPGTAANGVDTDNNSPPDVILVAADACAVSPGASITLEDGDGTRAVFTDQQRGITISAQDGSPRIEGPVGDFVGDHATFPDADTSFDTDGDYKVVASTGVTCGEGNPAGNGPTPADDQYEPGGPSGDINSPKDVLPDTVVGNRVPDTGGPAYMVLAAVALLFVALIAGRGILRR